MSHKAVPVPTPQTQPFWDGCAAGELRLQRCAPCARFFFPPQPSCPHCLGEDIAWGTLSGRARLHTYLISHVPAPGFEDEVPYAVAIVELHEGPRMMSNIVGVESTPEALVLDMDLDVTFVRRGDIVMPSFRPAATRPA
jgi:uncharacterized OB-fold protein